MHTRIKFSVTLALAAAAILITGCSGSWNTLKGIDEKDDKKEPSVSVACTPESVLNDCGSGFLCAEGKCERMSCETDSDCGGTLGCIDKKCFESLVIKRRVLGTSTDGILGCEYTYNAEGQLLSAQVVSGSRNKNLTNIDIEKPDSWIGLEREKAIELKYDDKKRIVSGIIFDPKRICIDSDVNFYLIGNEAEKRLAGEMVRLEENKVTPPTPPSIPSETPVVPPPYLPPLSTKDEILTTYDSDLSEIRINYANSGIIFEKILSEKNDPSDKEKVTSSKSHKHTYDGNGKLTEYKYKQSNETSVTYSKADKYEYDNKGRLKEYKYKESIHGDIDSKTGKIYSSKDAYTYNEEGRLTKKKYISADSGDLDDDARVKSSLEETYTYAGDGRLVEKKYRNSDLGDLDDEARVTNSFKETYTYNNEGILTEKNYKRVANGDVDKNEVITHSSKAIYTYYSNGRLREKKYKSADVDKNGTVQSGSMDTYFYDDSGRLTEHKSRQAATGNIDNPADITCSYKYMYTYDIKGRLAEKKFKYSYRGDVDDMGSVTSSRVYTYTYDNEGRLNEYEDKSSHSGDLDDGASINYSTKYTYTHDSNGKLKEKRKLEEKRYSHRGDSKNPETVTSSNVNTYAYDDEGRLVEYKDTFSNKGKIDDLKNATTSYKKVFQTIQEKPERSQLTPSNFACSEENLFGICPTPIMSCDGGKCSDKILIEPFKRFPEWQPPTGSGSFELEPQYPKPGQFDIRQPNPPETIE